MRFLGGRVVINSASNDSHGVENQVDEALKLLKEKITKSLKVYPENDIEIEYYING